MARDVLDRGTVAGLLHHLDHLMATRPEAAPSGLVAGVVVDDPTWLAAVADPRLLDLVEALLGPGVVLFSSCWVVKPPRRGRPVAWHQDGGTWPLDPLAAVTLWVALDDADAGNEGLRVVPGPIATGSSPTTGTTPGWPPSCSTSRSHRRAWTRRRRRRRASGRRRVGPTTRR